MELFKLFGTILVDNKKANAQIYETEKKAEGVTQKLGGGIKKAMAWGAGLATAGSLVVGGMIKTSSQVADTTDRIDKMSQKMGLSRQGFQEFDFILSQSGASVDAFGVGMKRLNTMAIDAQAGSKKSIEVFNQLDSSLLKLVNSGASQEEVLKATIEAFQKMPESAEKSRLSVELFGKQGQELMPLLNSQSGSLQEMTEQAHKLGLVLGDDTINAGVKFQDTLDQTKRSLDNLKTNLMASLLPATQKILEYVIAHMPQIQKAVTGFVTTTGNVLRPVFNFLGALFTWLGKIDKATGGLLTRVAQIIIVAAPLLLGILKITEKIQGLHKQVSGVTQGISGVSKVGKGFSGILTNSGFFGFAKWALIIAGVATAITLLINQINVLLGKGKQANQAFNAIGSIAKSGGSFIHGSHADGLARVPFNGYIAELHEGERVLTAQEAKSYNSSSDTIIINANVEDYSTLERIIKDAKERRQRIRALGGE